MVSILPRSLVKRAALTLLSALMVNVPSYANAMDACCDCYDYAYNPSLSSCAGIYTEFSYLYWRAKENGLYYAVDISGGLTNAYQGTFKEIPTKFDSGFRFGIGFQLPCKDWDVLLRWTNYETDPSDQLGSNQSVGTKGASLLSARSNGLSHRNVIVPTLPQITDSGFNVGAGFYQIFGQWRVDVNQIDLTAVRTFEVGPSLLLRPFFGLRGLIINQSFTTLWNSLDDLENSFLYNSRLECDYRAVGIVAGLGSTWALPGGFAIYGSFDASLVSGRFKTADTVDIFDQQGGSIIGSLSTRSAQARPVLLPTLKSNVMVQNNFDAVRAILDLEIGIQWSVPLTCYGALLTVKAGWEEHMFFSQNNFVQEFIGNVKSNGDLSLSGLSFSINASF